jgi:plasmid maintenance system antidote protein VapI
MQTSKKVVIFQLLKSQDEPLDAIVDYLLRRQCRQVSEIARVAGVHRDYVRRLIKGERNTNIGHNYF